MSDSDDNDSSDDDGEDAPLDPLHEAAISRWRTLGELVEKLCGLRKTDQHFDRLSVNDRHRFVNTCADLVLAPGGRGELIYHDQVITGLPVPLATEISTAVGSTILHRCIDDQRATASLTAIDLMILYLQDLVGRDRDGAESLMLSLAEPVFKIVLVRREHFGFAIDVNEPFERWPATRTDPFFKLLCTMASTETLKHDNATEAAIAGKVAAEALDWSFNVLAQCNDALAKQVRRELGRRLFEQVREWGLYRFATTALTYVIEYIDHYAKEKELKFDKALRGLEESAKNQLRTAKAEQQEESVPSGSTD